MQTEIGFGEDRQNLAKRWRDRSDTGRSCRGHSLTALFKRFMIVEDDEQILDL